MNNSIVGFLYETPGPKTRKLITVFTAVSVLLLAALLGLVIYRFYINDQFNPKYWSIFLRFTTWRFIAQGLFGTIKAALMGGLMAFIFGFVLMLLRISENKLVLGIGSVLVNFSRGVPTLLFIYFFFLFVPQLGIKLPAFWKICLPIAISAAGVVAEVLRSGVNAVPKGQSEAAYSLGMLKSHVFIKIVFPQGLKYVVPSLIAELVIVLKDTTFAYVVNYADLMQNAKVLISNYDALVAVYFVAAVIYILINYILNKIAHALSMRGSRVVDIEVNEA